MEIIDFDYNSFDIFIKIIKKLLDNIPSKL